ncbi:MFS transporter [Aestuariimicrobium ganziense]|uniref:MFS transporter n=1 Tax=Aestuariimicrobium ganziense TaxID=2773677 RepID=UPI0019424597|nr:MFS transporter [Aestuariimicrobium ganziense]
MSQFEAGTGLRGYARVLTHGPAIRPFGAAVVGRLPIGMTSLGMVMLIQQVRGNYSVAGVVTGVFALATAVGAAIWGRLMDQHGQPKVLVPTALLSGVAIAALAVAAVLGGSNLLLIALAAAAGVFFPPVSPAMRAAWRVIFTDGPSRRLGYALDASAVEVIFVLGPLLLSLLAAFSAPQVPLLTSAALLVIGTLLYSTTEAARSVGRVLVHADGHPPAPVVPDLASLVEGERIDRVPRTALAAPGIAVVLLVASLMAVGFGQMDTAIVATAEAVFGSTTKLGFLFMFIAGGSAIGGITYGSRDWPGTDPGRLVLLLSVFAASLVPWPFLLRLDEPPLPVLFALLFVTGVTIAPSLIIFQGLLDALAPRARMMEAQSLLSASQTTGAAIGTAVAGFTIDAFAAPGGIVGAAVAIGAGAAIAAYLRRTLQHRTLVY